MGAARAARAARAAGLHCGAVGAARAARLPDGRTQLEGSVARFLAQVGRAAVIPAPARLVPHTTATRH